MNLKSETLIFTILLPITSQGTGSPEDCTNNLTQLGLSLLLTTKNETCPQHNASFRLKIYLALDSDDGFLADGTKSEDALQGSNSFEIHRILCNFPKGHVCHLWCECAQHAWKEGADLRSHETSCESSCKQVERRLTLPFLFFLSLFFLSLFALSIIRLLTFIIAFFGHFHLFK